jgi:hypothetical protein
VSASVEQHRKEAPSSVNCMIITVSDTRTEETDKSGALLRELLETSGYRVTKYAIVKDEYEEGLSLRFLDLLGQPLYVLRSLYDGVDFFQVLHIK